MLTRLKTGITKNGLKIAEKIKEILSFIFDTILPIYLACHETYVVHGRGGRTLEHLKTHGF